MIISPIDPKTEYTLAELRELKQAWLTQAETGLITHCHTVAQALGEPFTPKGWDTWQGYKWQHGNLTITSYTGTGDYLPDRKAFKQIRTLVVSVRQGELTHRVAYCRDTTDFEPNDNFFVPGDWTQVVLYHLHAAHEALSARQAAGQEGERRQLEAQLLIGVDCSCCLPEQVCPVCRQTDQTSQDEPETEPEPETKWDRVDYEYERAIDK